MSDELNPCPFCGGEAEAWEYEDDVDVFDPQSLGWIENHCFITYCVGCDPCKVVISRRSKEDAAAAWNARAERTCRMVPMWEESDANGYVTCECDACGWMADYAADSEPFGWCASCGAKVVCDG